MTTFVSLALSTLIVCLVIKGLVDLRRGRVHWAMGHYFERRTSPRAFWIVTLLQWSGLVLMAYGLSIILGARS